MKNFIVSLDIRAVLKDIPPEIRDVAEYVIENAQNKKRNQKRYFEAIDKLGDYVESPEVRLVIIWAMGPFIEREVNKFLFENFGEEYTTLASMKEDIIGDLIVWLLEKIQQYDANYSREGYTGNKMYLVTYVERLLKRRIWGHLFHLVKSKRLGYDYLENQTELQSDDGESVDSLYYISEVQAYEEYVSDDIFVLEPSNEDPLQLIIRYKRKTYGVK